MTSPTLLLIRFHYSCSEEELADRSRKAAAPISHVPGLLWKIWIHDPDRTLAGGIYCFEHDQAAEAYLGGPIVGGLRRMPDVSDFSAERLWTRPELGRLTRSPVPGPTNEP